MKSPVPYSIAEAFGNDTRSILAADDSHVATCYSYGNTEADAEFIIKACNAHEALVNALEKLEALIGRIEIGSVCREPVSHLLGNSMFLVNAKAAIEKAHKVLP